VKWFISYTYRNSNITYVPPHAVCIYEFKEETDFFPYMIQGIQLPKKSAMLRAIRSTNPNISETDYVLITNFRPIPDGWEES